MSADQGRGSEGTSGSGQPVHHTFLAIFPSIMLPMFLAVVDQTIVATALPAIAVDTGNVARASWVVVSYLIASTVAAPIYGRLGDAFGRRPRTAGPRWRWVDDFIAGSDRRSYTAARTRPLSGLSRRRRRLRELL